MSHDIEVSDDGRATFVAVKQHGWHQLGTVVDHPISVSEGLKLAHLADLDYRLAPIACRVGDEWVGSDYYGVVRNNPFSIGDFQVVGAGLSENFTVHTPEDAFGFGEAIIEQGQPLAAMGSIKQGKRAFAAFSLEDITIGGVDQVRSFLNIMTAFDGSMATYARVSMIRVECANTFSAVMSQGAMPTFRVRHTGANLEARIDEARTALGVGWKGLEEFQRQAELMMDRTITDAQFDKIVEALFPMPDEQGSRAWINKYEAQTKVRSLYEGDTVKNIRGTAWGAMNAVTEFYDWTAGGYKSQEARMVAQITPGSPLDAKRIKAGALVASMVGIK